MGTLNQYEKELIIEKAALLQKISESSGTSSADFESTALTELFGITDDLNLNREMVREAYIEYLGIPVNDPVIVDTGDASSAEVIGRASGRIDREVLTELKAQTEYHFNTVGSISSRKNKLIWKARPSGPSRLFASTESPEVHFEQRDSETLIRVKQSLKTHNKFYLPGLMGAMISLGMLGAVIFSRAGNEEAPMVVIGILFGIGSFFYSKFITNRKKKAKRKLADLTETLQGIMERRFKVVRGESRDNRSIETGDLANSPEEIINEPEYSPSNRVGN